jgi:hypothetical protein
MIEKGTLSIKPSDRAPVKNDQTAFTPRRPTRKRMIVSVVFVLAFACGCSAPPPLIHRPPQSLQLPAPCVAANLPPITLNVDCSTAFRCDQPLPAEAYTLLDPEECRARSAVNAPLADLYALEPTFWCDRLRRELLCLKESEIRNRAAASALELYYRILETELRRAPLRRQQQALDELLAEFDSLRAKGLSVPIDEQALRRQKAALIAQRMTLEKSAERLREQLVSLVGFPAGSPPIAPRDDLTIRAPSFDVSAEVERGLQERPDLLQIQALNGWVCKETLPIVRAILSSAAPGTGSAVVPPKRHRWWWQKPLAMNETKARIAQLSLLSDTKREMVCSEIRVAIREIEEQTSLALLAEREVKDSQARYENLRKKLGGPGVTPSEVYTALTASCQAEQELISRAIQWKLSWVKLRSAQGTLGYSPLKP